jgi:hypothetical protein
MAVERKRVPATEGLKLLGLGDKGEITVATQVKRARLCAYRLVGGRVMTAQGEVVSATVLTDGNKPPQVTFWRR